MTKGWVTFLLTSVLATSPIAHTQTSPTQTPATGDYSKEAVVIEEMITKLAFDNGGSSTREQTSRVRVQSDAGVKQWGLLSFPFQSATQSLEIDYVRVHKANGGVIVTPADNVQDLDAEITRSAPFYSDLREKHVAVKGLAAGDILEYKAHWRTTKALIPGQFWFQYNFHQDSIVLSERLEIKVPLERAVKVKGPLATQTVATEAGFRVYTWTHSKLESGKTNGIDQKNATDVSLGRLSPPDVQITSFQSWDDVGRWYWSLQNDRVEPTPTIRAKAAELTKGMTDNIAKLQALYSFVSTQYRYIGIAFGIGRYQPHAADDVLTNSYGDCKDKQTLLASLLQASGITLYPALINSGWKIDPDIPSPAQFDHVIGYLPGAKETVWLDSTVEVAPPGYLVPRLRNKQALVIAGEKIQLVATPEDPHDSSSETFKIDGKLSDDGTLEAKVEDTSRGDGEIVLRAAFRQVPQSQWKDLVQQISYGLGYAGTVSDVSAGAPEAVNGPFHFSYSYSRKDYPDWSNRQITVPGLPFLLPPVRQDAKYPVWLGSPSETLSDSKMELPAGFRPEVPPSVDLKYDFAEYHAAYSLDHGALIAKRRLLIKLHEIPVAEFEDYRSFLKNMQNDVNRYVQTSSGTPTLQKAPFAGGVPSFVSGIQSLPESESSEASRLEAAARDEMGKREVQGAVSSLYRAVSADPKFTRAWVFLGVLLLAQKQMDAGIEAFHKAIAVDPSQPAIPKALGFGLMSDSKFEDAVPVWQEFIKAFPDDVDGPGNLGNCLLKLKRYSEAAAAYEAAVKIKADRPNLQASLGSAYLLAGDREKAGAAFAKLGDLDKEGNYLNDVAYQMANADLQLPLALDYARRAVRGVEDESQKITLQELKVEDLRKIFKVSAYWDTLGWVYERMSKMDAAEQYLQASWKLTQDGTVAGHLCHLYKRAHKMTAAVEMCRLAVYRIPMSEGLALSEYKTEMDAAQENLDKLTAATAKPNKVVDASDLVIRERTFKLPRFLAGTESAEFFVLLAADGNAKTFKVEDVKFINGSDKMKLQGKQIKSIDFDVPAASDVRTHVVRRGILGCYQYSGCSFVLLDPATVHSLN